LLVPQRVDLRYQYDVLRFDWWLLDFQTAEARRTFPGGLPLLLGLFGGGLVFGVTGLRRRMAAAKTAVAKSA
jgi:hypothetical protein